MKKKVSIHGFYGMGNLGDEAILHAFRGELERFPYIKLSVFSRNPAEVRKIHGLRSVSCRGKKNYFRRLYEIKTSSLFVLGGGGLLKDYGEDASSLKGWLELLNYAKKLGIKTSVFCVGVENIRFEASQKALRKSLNAVDFISVRDRESKSLLKNLGIRNQVGISSDPAVLLGRPKPKVFDSTCPVRVMFCLRHWFSTGQFIKNPKAEANLIDSLAGLADFIVARHGAKIHFLPFRTISYDDDRVMANRVVERMEYSAKAIIHKTVPSLAHFMKIVNESSILVGMRLHSLILAASCGIPILGIEYMPKVVRFLKSINQRHYSVRVEDVSERILIELFEKTFENYEQRSKEICSEIPKLAILAKKSISNMIELTEGS